MSKRLENFEPIINDYPFHEEILNGKKYSTDTAKILLSSEGEHLFQKQTGEYFLLVKDMLFDAFHIEPLSEQKCKNYVEAHYNEHYEAIFGAVSE